MNNLEKSLTELGQKIAENNRWRQRQCFNLIPSENTPSLLVKLCEISDPCGRYAEHKTALKKEREVLSGTGTLKGDQVYYYQGTDFIFEVEEKLKSEFGKYVSASEVEARPISGQMANEIVFKAVVRFLAAGEGDFPRLTDSRRLASVMNNHLNYGGHLSAQPFGALFNFVEGNIINFPLDKKNAYKIDVDTMLELVDEKRPSLIVFGKSMFLHPEPVKQLRALVDSINGYYPIIMYDAAHVMGIVGPHFQDPLEDGADVITGSTHKTFFGPQRGVIASNLAPEHPMRKLWTEVNGRTFPGSTSNHHLGTLLALMVATLEMNQFKDKYQKQVVSNAKAFAKACAKHGLDVEGGEEDGYTTTHQVILRTTRFGDGKEMAKRLEDNNIITNYQALPGDETFYYPSGIRMGVSEMTRFGMKEKDFDTLARQIADTIIDNKIVADEVADYRRQFQSMQYCLGVEETLRIVPAIVESLFPAFEYFKSLAKSLNT